MSDKNTWSQGKIAAAWHFRRSSSEHFERDLAEAVESVDGCRISRVVTDSEDRVALVDIRAHADSAPLTLHNAVLLSSSTATAGLELDVYLNTDVFVPITRGQRDNRDNAARNSQILANLLTELERHGFSLETYDSDHYQDQMTATGFSMPDGEVHSP